MYKLTTTTNWWSSICWYNYFSLLRYHTSLYIHTSISCLIPPLLTLTSVPVPSGPKGFTMYYLCAFSTVRTPRPPCYCVVSWCLLVLGIFVGCPFVLGREARAPTLPGSLSSRTFPLCYSVMPALFRLPISLPLPRTCPSPLVLVISSPLVEVVGHINII